jgi:hypothetical protein
VYINRDNEAEEKIIVELYILSNKLKKIENSNSVRYSNNLFLELKNVINNAQKLREKNLKATINEFFILTDILFEKEINKSITKKEKKYTMIL